MGNQEICSSVSSSLPVAMSSSSWSATPLTLKGSMWWSIRTQGFLDIARFYNFFGTHPNQNFWKMQYHDQEPESDIDKNNTDEINENSEQVENDEERIESGSSREEMTIHMNGLTNGDIELWR